MISMERKVEEELWSAGLSEVGAGPYCLPQENDTSDAAKRLLLSLSLSKNRMLDFCKKQDAKLLLSQICFVINRCGMCTSSTFSRMA